MQRWPMNGIDHECTDTSFALTFLLIAVRKNQQKKNFLDDWDDTPSPTASARGRYHARAAGEESGVGSLMAGRDEFGAKKRLGEVHQPGHDDDMQETAVRLISFCRLPEHGSLCILSYDQVICGLLMLAVFRRHLTVRA